MPFYECVFIARQDVTAQANDALADKFADIIAANGGKVSKRENWGLRQLAYRIAKNRKGYYTLFNIDAPASAVKEMERTMSIDEDILRYMTIKVESLEEGPSVMMAPRSGNAKDDSDKFDFNEEVSVLEEREEV